MKSAFEKCAEEGIPFNISYRLESAKNKSLLWINTRGSRVGFDEKGRPLIHAVYSTVSENEKAYQTIFDSTKNMLNIVDGKTGEIFFTNRSLREYLGLKEEDINGKVCYKAMMGNDSPCKDCPLSTYERKAKNFIVKNKGKTYRVFSKPIIWNGKEARADILNDISDLENQKENLEDINKILSEQKQNMEAAIKQADMAYFRIDYLKDGINKLATNPSSDLLDKIKDSDIDFTITADIQAEINKMRKHRNGCKQLTFLRRNGQKTYFEFKYNNVYFKKEPIYAFCSLRNIDQKISMIEKDLKSSIVLSNSNFQTWEYDIVNRSLVFEGTFNNSKPKATVFFKLPESLINYKELPKASIQRISEVFSRINKGAKKAECEYWIPDEKRDNQYFRLHLVTIPTKDKEKPTKAIGWTINVTEERKATTQFEKVIVHKSLASDQVIAKAHSNFTKDALIQFIVLGTDIAEGKLPSLNSPLKKEWMRGVFSSKDKEDLYKILDTDFILANFHKGKKDFSVSYIKKIKNKTLAMKTSVIVFRNEITKDIEGYYYTYNITNSYIVSKAVSKISYSKYNFIGFINCKSKKIQGSKKASISTSILRKKAVLVNPFLKEVIKTAATPKEHQEYLEKINYSNIVNELTKNPSFVYTIHLMKNKKESYRRLEFSYVDLHQLTIFMTISDITNVFKEQLLQKERLQKALSVAEKANQAKTEFLSKMSHDLRTPLNAVLGFADLALDDDNDLDSMKQEINNIKTSGNYLLGLINDILDISKIESNKICLNPENTDILSFLNESVSSLKPLGDVKDIEIRTDFTDISHRFVKLDRLRLRKIISNLISNSIKYSNPDTHITFSVTEKRASDGLAHFQLKIADQGIGMSHEFLHQAFDKFSQEINKFSDTGVGTGLGLSITKSLIDLMKGSIDIKSEINVGTTVTVKLSFPIASENCKTIHKEQSYSSKIPLLKNKRVLICEDNVINSEIFVRILSKKGIITETATDGKIGLQLFTKSNPGYYDAILMDIRMPNMDGIEATKRIRALNRKDSKTIPIIALTANAFEEDKENCLDAGMNSHLSKPIDINLLLKTLAKEMKI